MLEKEQAAEPGLEEAARSQSHSDRAEAVSSNAERKSRRPILSVRTPVEAAEARVPFVQRVVFEQYGQRDWTIFEQYARDARIERLEIQDPYCCADEQARGRLINFIGRFEQLASEIAAVQIVTFDADSVQTRDPESTRDQRQDLEDRWNRMLASVPPPPRTEVTAVRRRPARSFREGETGKWRYRHLGSWTGYRRCHERALVVRCKCFL